MADHDDENGPVRPRREHRDDGELTLLPKSARTVVPPVLKGVFAQNSHISSWLPRMNASYCFLQKKRGMEKKRAAQERHDTKRRRVEDTKRTQDGLYPPHRFIEADRESDCAADVKGSVVLPDSSSSVCVEGFVLQIEPDGKTALLVLYTTLDIPRRYFPALCPVALLPNVVSKTTKRLSKKAKAEWTSTVEFDTLSVKRANQDVQLITSGPFSNRTCDDAMASSIRSGFLLAVRGSKSRNKYGACPVRFDRGQLLQTSKTFIVSHEAGVLHLNYPVRSASNAAERILALAMAARNDLIEVAPNGSMAGALHLMERFSHNAKGFETEWHRCINVALGGSCTLGDYGRFIACKELANTLSVSEWFIRGNTL